VNVFEFQTINTPEEEQEHGTPEAFVSTPNIEALSMNIFFLIIHFIIAEMPN
jgi:hypothetical protein